MGRMLNSAEQRWTRLYDSGLKSHVLWSSTKVVYWTGTLPAPLPVLPSPGFLELGWKNFR